MLIKNFLGNIIQVGEDKKIDYPYNSVSYMLNKKVKEDENLREKLEGFTIVSSYLSQEDEETAKLINGKLLMKVDEQVKFNSKYFLKKISEKYRFSTPKGKYFCGLNNIENVITKAIIRTIQIINIIFFLFNLLFI